jgi:hypothetical protein
MPLLYRNTYRGVLYGYSWLLEQASLLRACELDESVWCIGSLHMMQCRKWMPFKRVWESPCDSCISIHIKVDYTGIAGYSDKSPPARMRAR